MTETHTALSMITKAGVATHKIVVGVTSYGRSYQMTTPGCTGPDCTYEGPTSKATQGSCTVTNGYLAYAEINQIIATNQNIQRFKDDSDSNILVYNSNQWVAYMDDTTKAGRISTYRGWKFRGSSDWAVDLQAVVPQPIADTAPDDPSINSAINPYIEGCSPGQANLIRQSWQDAGMLARAHYEWVPGGKWQPAMDLYLGKGSANDHSFFWGDRPRLSKYHPNLIVVWSETTVELS